MSKGQLNVLENILICFFAENSQNFTQMLNYSFLYILDPLCSFSLTTFPPNLSYFSTPKQASYYA